MAAVAEERALVYIEALFPGHRSLANDNLFGMKGHSSRALWVCMVCVCVCGPLNTGRGFESCVAIFVDGGHFYWWLEQVWRLDVPATHSKCISIVSCSNVSFLVPCLS